jgi:hypothetical protein
MLRTQPASPFSPSGWLPLSRMGGNTHGLQSTLPSIRRARFLDRGFPHFWQDRFMSPSLRQPCGGPLCRLRQQSLSPIPPQPRQVGASRHTR